MEFLALEPLNILGLFGVGILSGILAGFFGIGGGAIIVPMMILFGNDIKIAIGISIMQMIFSSIYGSYVNYKKKNLDFKDGVFVGIGGLIGASFSGVIVDNVPSNILEIVFTCFIVYSIIKFFRANAYGGERKIDEGR
ncbi:sulfite exporter TauE/SafE family protein, partial [Helicobacter pullorum]